MGLFNGLLSCSNVSAPQIGNAQLLWNFGEIKREDSVIFNSIQPIDFTDWFVRIRTMTAGKLDVVFVGIITDTETVYDRATSLSGDQVITAQELGYMLDRIKIDRAYTDDGFTLDWTPTFNLSGKNPNQELGNKSTSENVFAAHDNQFDGQQVWRNSDIIEYLLDNFAPAGIPIYLRDIEGNYLNSITNIHDLSDMTIWEALNQLIDRRRGIGFYLFISQSNQIIINVYSLSDFTINIGSKTLPANNNKTNFSFPTSLPQSHMVGDVPFAVLSANHYDEIRVRGDRILVTATFSYEDETLVKGWSQELEDAYLAAADSTSARENDLFRAASIYNDVFRTHIVPEDWDGSCGDGNGGAKTSVMPKTYDNGDVLFEDAPDVAHWWRGQKWFERATPLKHARDYSESPILVKSDTKTENENVPLIAIIKDDQKGDEHEQDHKYHHVELLKEANYRLEGTDVIVMQKALGFSLNAPPLYYALTHYIPPPGSLGSQDAVTGHNVELNYEDLLCTGSFVTDQRQHVAVKRSEDPVKKLTITVPAAQYWYVARDTVVAIDDEGELLRIHEDNLILRNDLDLLLSVLAAALGWYGVQRQAVSIPIMQPGRFVEIGTFITSINSIARRESVRTPVTARTIDFQTNTTVIQTAFSEIDFNVFTEAR